MNEQNEAVPDTSAGAPAGVTVIHEGLKTLPESPGVYRMLDERGGALYVGKARNLKKRVIAYTRIDQLPVRLQRMVLQTAALEIITTHTEIEALLLESNLIKRLHPRYNILLRDDKSFPYILITGDHAWPRLVKHRGPRREGGEYFGPFASAGAVTQALSTLQRAFLLRSCTDLVFAARTRPCLLYQIKRCAAPCTGRIAAEAYEGLVAQTRAFLSGRSSRVQQDLARRMEEAAERLDYEAAALLRDRIRALSVLQARQDINLPHLDDADVIALHQGGGQACLQVFFFRGGHNYGNRACFPAQTRDEEAGAVLSAFIGQFYDDKIPPPEILVSHPVPEQDLIAAALTWKAGRKVQILTALRGDRRKLMDLALMNARAALDRRLAESATWRQGLEAVGRLFDCLTLPERIEVYDNSHVSGTHAVGAMIVAGPEGFVKSAYRHFNIKDRHAAPGDDYAMMREVLARRFRHAVKNEAAVLPDLVLPDLVLIDGGPGQLNAACAVLTEECACAVRVVAIAKGPDRNAGRETFYRVGREPFTLPPNDPTLHVLQRLRDEAHRFAVGSHRARRTQALRLSLLDEIEGVGARRKKALLHHFGSARAVAEAGFADLEAVAGISRVLAKKVHDHFHAKG